MNNYNLKIRIDKFKSSPLNLTNPEKAYAIIEDLESYIEELETALERERRDPGGKSWENVR